MASPSHFSYFGSRKRSGQLFLDPSSLPVSFGGAHSCPHSLHPSPSPPLACHHTVHLDLSLSLSPPPSKRHRALIGQTPFSPNIPPLTPASCPLHSTTDSSSIGSVGSVSSLNGADEVDLELHLGLPHNKESSVFKIKCGQPQPPVDVAAFSSLESCETATCAADVPSDVMATRAKDHRVQGVPRAHHMGAADIWLQQQHSSLSHSHLGHFVGAASRATRLSSGPHSPPQTAQSTPCNRGDAVVRSLLCQLSKKHSRQAPGAVSRGPAASKQQGMGQVPEGEETVHNAGEWMVRPGVKGKAEEPEVQIKERHVDHTCQLCGMRFSKYQALGGHMRKHLGEVEHPSRSQ